LALQLGDDPDAQSMRPRRDCFEHVAGKIMRAPREVIDRKYPDHRLPSI
jgi:hypothetical protein